MSRPRKHNTGLPDYVRIKNGAYHYRGKKLCRVDAGESAMYDELAKRKALPKLDKVPAAVAAFKLEYLSDLSPSAKKEYTRLLDIFSNDFSEFRVDQITAVDVKRSIRNLFGDKRSAAKAYKSRMSTFFRWCVEEEGLRQSNPCREVWLKKPVRKKTPWNDALFWKARDKLADMMQCYHDLSFLVYQRTTDIRHLMRSQIHDGIIHFEPSKTEESSGGQVDVPITPTIQAVLDRAAKLGKLQAGPGGDAPVIQTSGGTIYTRSGIYSAYRKVDIALHGKDNILNLNPKALRAYAATTAKKQGFSKEDIQTGLVHTTISTTEGYIQQHEVPVSVVMLTYPPRPQGA